MSPASSVPTLPGSASPAALGAAQHQSVLGGDGQAQHRRVEHGQRGQGSHPGALRVSVKRDLSGAERDLDEGGVKKIKELNIMGLKEPWILVIDVIRKISRFVLP